MYTQINLKLSELHLNFQSHKQATAEKETFLKAHTSTHTV